ncbi:MAG: class D sortase [Candidatus Eisenbacteria bacterium]|uniref:Class D sortase n=1 Tax=Eiseniibacteriota bacterium TaxID=2212470 RepID=A0A9D6L6E2_UNCEI|nr:class D sortase [Candidatus Eisenbacteria bacterium]
MSRVVWRSIEGGSYLVATLLLGYWLWANADGWLSQRRLARRLEELIASYGAPHATERAFATRREAQRGGPVGRITIPRLGVSALVLEGATSRSLRRGVGHLETSAFPGEPGNVDLAAHRDTYFHALEAIAPGDRVVLSTPDGRFEYRVDWARVVPPNRTDLLAPTGSRRLTLVTCYPFDWIGPAPDRFVVRASPVETQTP